MAAVVVAVIMVNNRGMTSVINGVSAAGGCPGPNAFSHAGHGDVSTTTAAKLIIITTKTNERIRDKKRP